MSPVDRNQYLSLPSFEGKLQDHPNSITFYPIYETVSSVSCPNSSQPSIAEVHDHDDNKVEREHFPDYDVSSYDLLQSPASQSTTDGEDRGNTDTKKCVSDNSKNNGSTKWMSSKMRMMRKLRNPDGVITAKMGSDMGTQEHPGESSSLSNDTTPRVCSDCSTTKTPLWRCGPQGPKSLCNACGIRQRKARKAAAAAMNGGLTPNNVSSIKAISKDRESDGGMCAVVPIKKRIKFFSSEAQEKLQRDDFDMGLNRSSDEKEAAILLMALSSDMIFG